MLRFITVMTTMLLPSPRRSVSGEGIVVLGVCVSVCLSAEPRLQTRHIILCGEGHVLYPVLSNLVFIVG